MTETTIHNQPAPEKILSMLIELYADQQGVKVEYEIKEGGAENALYG